MLVLSRKKNESIRIGDNIEVKVLDVRGDRVRLGIVAPPEVNVMRQELLPTDKEPSAGFVPDDTTIALADGPGCNDTLRSGSARNHTTRNHNHHSWRPR